MSVDEREVKIIERSAAKSWLSGIVGAAVGGAVGWFLFGLIADQGFYALALPGAAVGLGFGAFSRKPMIIGGLFCAVVALPLMLFCEWQVSPFSDDKSFTYFLMNVYRLDSSMTYVLLGLGTLFAFWFGRGR